MSDPYAPHPQPPSGAYGQPAPGTSGGYGQPVQTSTPAAPFEQAPPAGPYQQMPPAPSTGTGWAIAGMLLFWPLGIPALLAAQRAARALGAGDLATNAAEAGRARMWGLWSIGTCVAWVVLVVGSYVWMVFAFLSMTSQMSGW